MRRVRQMLDETSMIVMRFKLAILGRLQVMKKLKACAVRMLADAHLCTCRQRNLIECMHLFHEP